MWLLNSQPVSGGAASPGRGAYWYDFADSDLRLQRAQDLANRVISNGYGGVFLDTLGFEQLPAEMRHVYTERHPDLDYNTAQAGFLQALRTCLGPDRRLFLNQGYRQAEIFLPHASLDLTESYFTAASSDTTTFRPWYDPRRPWESILIPMEKLVMPASRRFPKVEFVHLGYAAGPPAQAYRAIQYNYAAAKLWDHDAYLMMPTPQREQHEIYFMDLGRPLSVYSHDPGKGVAWREFERGIVALNTGPTPASILNGRYHLSDPPRGYIFRH